MNARIKPSNGSMDRHGATCAQCVISFHVDPLRHLGGYPLKFEFPGLKKKLPYRPILLPVMNFSNVCQKMIPVLDNYFHRLFEIEMEMEISALYDTFNNVLTRCCSLYRFHPMPITYLYQSLYYFPRLR